MKKTKKPAKLLLAASAVLLLAAAVDPRLKTVTYTVHSDKVESTVRLAVAADLHSCRYGENQETLLNAVRAASPDAVLLPGDFYDDELSTDNARLFARTIAAEYPTFYVTGNHEIASKRDEEMKEELRSFGVTVLDGDAVPLITAAGDVIWIAGADDPAVGAEKAAQQRTRARAAVPEGEFALLLSHRPELTEEYSALGFDLVIAGHAHGGQWRIPFLLNGLLAPNQGFFPAYAGGLYELENTTLIVSRGLARETTAVPRIFNRPELVIVEIQN